MIWPIDRWYVAARDLGVMEARHRRDAAGPTVGQHIHRAIDSLMRRARA